MPLCAACQQQHTFQQDLHSTPSTHIFTTSPSLTSVASPLRGEKWPMQLQGGGVVCVGLLSWHSKLAVFMHHPQQHQAKTAAAAASPQVRHFMACSLTC